MIVFESYGEQSGYEKLEPTASTGFTAALIAPTTGTYKNHKAKVAIIKPLTQVINFRMDGTAPTAVAGMQLAVGDYFVIEGYQNIKNFRCIDTAAGASEVRCLFFF